METWTVTANRLSDGGVVYLRSDRVWSHALSDAWTGEMLEEAEVQIEWARGRENEVCDPYALRVDREGARLVPRTARERIRAEGPGPTLERLGYATPSGSPRPEPRRRAG